MDRCSAATGPLDRRLTSRGRGREAVTPRAALGHRTNRSVPGLRRGKLADGRNNFGLWQSALGRQSQEETELRKGKSVNIGLIGPGDIGAVIVKKLRDAGYPVKMANSKGP